MTEVTTMQINAAPKGAFYVVPESLESAFRDTVKALGRGDLKVTSADPLLLRIGRGHVSVVVDHSVERR